MDKFDKCDYVDPARAKQGIDRKNNIISHIIYNNASCIQSDSTKTAQNIKNLENTSELPIYCVVAHGKIVSDINVTILKEKVVGDDGKFVIKNNGDVLIKDTYHINTPSSTFFNLKSNQYVYDTAPIGTSLACSSHLKRYINSIIIKPKLEKAPVDELDADEPMAKKSNIDESNIDEPTKFKNTLFSNQFRTLSESISASTVKFDAPLFSPPQFSTINKTLDFYDKEDTSSLRFGVFRLDKPITSAMKQALDSIGKHLTTITPDEKKSRCLNVSVGNLTGNVVAEQNFIDHLHRNNFRCSLKELTEIFGDGIYIMTTCSELELKIKINRETISYSSASNTGIKKRSSPYGRNGIVVSKTIIDNIVYAFNSDLAEIVRELEYRWIEMVQGKNSDVGTKTHKLQINVGEDMYKKIIEIPEMDNMDLDEKPQTMEVDEDEETPTEIDEDEIRTDVDEDETATQPDEDTTYMDVDVNGGKKNQKHTTKKQRNTRKQTKKNKKHITKKQKNPRKRTTIKPRRRRSTRHRRS
jgi:hypothetical protein